ncbi:MAG: hypothetical protein WBW04_17780 [Nitrolancea sp.]
MPKKTTRSRRDGKTRVNEAQLQAYRARKAETVAHPDAKPDAPVESSRQTTSSGVVTAWGHVGEEYDMIKSDLVRLFIITAVMFVIILILWFFLA